MKKGKYDDQADEIDHNDDVAIVGISCRFPGAENYNVFWDNLVKGIDSVQEINRWNFEGHYSNSNEDLKSVSKWIGLLKNIDEFDNRFFNISPREAAHMDPKQRILLEETQHCVEDSGISLDVLRKKKTSVYVAAMASELYIDYTSDSKIDMSSGLGLHHFMLSNRISYFFGFNGESKVIDAACASVMAALNDALKSFSARENDYAVLAGVNIYLSPLRYMTWSRNRMLSTEGKCKTFDIDANGFVGGEGAGVILLQPLSRAIKDHNNIYGIIKGCAVNHGGKSNSVSSPRIEAQKEAILSAYNEAGFTPETVTYLEAHGTGTSLGDPIEIEALTRAFNNYTNEKSYCKIGSVKTNIGHLEGAAGIAGIIKVILMLRHKQIPPTLNIKTINPIIDFENSPFSVAESLSEWKPFKNSLPLRAGVSSFGLGGVNGHVLIEEYINKTGKKRGSEAVDITFPFILSAKNQTSLEGLLKEWRVFIKSDDFLKYNLNDICLTLLAGREGHPYRCGRMVNSKEEITGFLEEKNSSYFNSADDKQLFLIFDEYKWEPGGDYSLLKKDIDVILKRLDEKYKQLNIIDNFNNSNWSKTSSAINNFLLSYVYSSFLIKLDLCANLISGAGNGFWAGLAISEIVSPDEIFEVLTGEKTLKDIKYQRPLIPFYDPLNKKIIKPFIFDKYYINNLIDIDIPEEAMLHYFNKTFLLYNKQYTLKKYLEEWEIILKPESIHLKDFLENQNYLRDKPPSKEIKLLLLIVMASSFYKLNKKWDLSERYQVPDDRFYELLDLIQDEVMPKDKIAAILINKNNEAARAIDDAVSILNAGQDKLDRNKEYKYLRNCRQMLPEIQNFSDWAGEILLLKQFSDLPDLKCMRFSDFNPGSNNIYDYIKTVSLRLWLGGASINWSSLFKDHIYNKVSLPVYAFDRSSFWLNNNVNTKNLCSLDLNYRNPLLQENTSNFNEQKYSSLLTGEEYFLNDHRLNGRKVLPGVAYLEMARAAVESASGIEKEGMQITIKNVVWLNPAVVGEKALKINIALIHSEKGELGYEIYSENEDGAEILHSQGIAEIKEKKEIKEIDINAEKQKKWEIEFTGEECYRKYREIGVEFGEGHRALERVFLKGDEILAKLKMPSKAAESAGKFMLDPAMADSAIQAVIAISMEGESEGPAVPYALDEIEIIDKSKEIMWVTLKKAEGKQGNIFDINMIDENGKICVCMKGLQLRVMKDAMKGCLMLLEPSWKEEDVKAAGDREELPDRLVFLCEPEGMTEEEMESIKKGARIIVLKPGADGIGIGDRYLQYSIRMIEELQEIIKEKGDEKVLVQLVVFVQGDRGIFSGLNGILRTVQKENPKIKGQLIELEANEELAGISVKLEENGGSLEKRIRYRKGKRCVEDWKEIESGEKADIPWKDGGVYLITGGAGGIGRIIAGEISEKTKGAALILAGRSSLSKDKEAWIEALQEKGGKAEYLRADVADREDVKSLIGYIKKKYGKLNGIIHSAGVIKDSFILKKNAGEIEEVFSPKVKGTVNLDEESRGMELDIFIMFSSVAGIIGNIGQADYSAANAFMDGYAKHRPGKGKTVSIDWPVWKDGGMKIDGESLKILTMQTGISAMETGAGIQALYRSISSDCSQVMVIEGNFNIVKKQLIPGTVTAVIAPAVVKEGGEQPFNEDSVREKAVGYFKKLLSSTIKLPPQQIEANAPLEKYGIDSIMAIQMTNQLEKVFGSLSHTLFFEYRNIEEIAAYFLKAYRGKLNEILGSAEKPAVSAETELLSVRDRRRGRFAPAVAGNKEVKSRQGIAIIGISGRYPGAKNTEEFWDNLKEGRDSITEIPADRWDHSLYFDEDKEKAGKAYSKWGGFIEDVDKFDPLFFNISPREAGIMDPQERIFLECAYNTMEDAGYVREGLGVRVGVYAGVMYEEYQLYGAQEQAYGRMTALGGNPSSIANRVSYVMNFQGPSMAVDTMCSSSLTAVHLACQSLERGECAAAIAGGVNVSIHPNKYLFLSHGKFVSSKGRCESFGKGGDGYVPGEGVGAVLLKPLRNAIDDGDHIYGVIRGSSLNAGGKTNGYTVPNPSAQGEVIREAIESAGVNARSISYIEAHGTGTSLGDPIEIAGLTRAFAHFTQDKQYCAIGSVKSNIGHCESAAGIAAITKVILQMKHRQLVPSLHSEVLNPNIDFMETPFMVQQELSEWKSEYPRIAGISSFGAGGSNAHIVIEEYIPENKERPAEDPASENPAIIVLSARNEERLREKAKDLLSAIGREGYGDGRLADIAYTLQAGREGMEERLGFTAVTIKELEEKLKAYLNGNDGSMELYRGQLKQNKETLNLITANEEMREALEKWIIRKKYINILELWAKGLAFDWNRLYKADKPRRISLPAYPFTRDRYWIKTGTAKQGDSRASVHLHPLVQENTSSLKEQRFSSIFTGDEIFLNHRVKGSKVFPAMVYLEMARAAASISNVAGKVGIRFKNVAWGDLLSVEEGPVKINIELEPDQDGNILYEIYARGRNDAIIVYSQGTLEIINEGRDAVIDVKSLQGRKWSREFSSDDCYNAFREMGIDYGPGLRGIETVYAGEGEALARLEIPVSFRENPGAGQYIIHPAMLDSALQAAIGLIMGSGDANIKSGYMPSLPAALESMELYNPCLPRMWARIRYRTGKTDIDLLDDSGVICIRLSGLSYNPETQTPEAAPGVQPAKISLAGLSDRERSLNIVSAKPTGISIGSLTDKSALSYGAALQAKPVAGLMPGKPLSFENDTSKQVRIEGPVSEKSLLEYLRKTFSEVLYLNISDVDTDKNFIDMGMDSITAVEWINTVNKHYNSAIATTKIYDYHNIRELSCFLSKEFGDQPGKSGKKTVETPTAAVLSLKTSRVLQPLLAGKERNLNYFYRFLQKRSGEEGAGIAYKHGKEDKIAIVGMSGRYPGASDTEQFWNNLEHGVNSISEILISRWDINRYYDPRPLTNGKTYCKWMGMMDDVENFDPLFFNISPSDAEFMDPQHRIFLQEGYKAFEDAGYNPQLLSNKKCGVYLGIMSNEYGNMIYQNPGAAANITGNSYAIGAARIPYFLNLKGPAIPIDTACSSSLVAAYLACQALSNHEIEMALAGGISLYLTPQTYIGMCAAGMLSPDGQCHTFDNGANGFVPGEGAGAIVLKRLEDAEKDHDHIYGVIIGAGINQDGKTNGITAPSINSQIELEREIYKKYEIEPETIGYVEMHGTGTKLGDPIELEALSTIYKEGTGKKNYCAIGSVKSNIGHTSAAAGVAGIQKVLLCIKNKKLVPTLNYRIPNENFNFEDSPFYVNTVLKEWDKGTKTPRRAGVSSFGFSGTNAHVVIEEYIPGMMAERPGEAGNKILFILSAKKKEQLAIYAERMKNWMESRAEINMQDLAYTLQAGRDEMNFRLAFTADSKITIIKTLESFITGENSTDILAGEVKNTKEEIKLFDSDEEAKSITEDWINKGQFKKIAEIWVKGFKIDWNRLYRGYKPYRISLPAYPFARERYWIEQDAKGKNSGIGAKRIHPLLHENTSDFRGQAYSSVFTGEEVFLSGHKVMGRKVLPGAAHLEMARAAVEAAGGTGQKGIRIRNVVWASPVVVDEEPVKVNIALESLENGEIKFDVFSETGDGEELIHSQGAAEIFDAGEEIMDIKALREKKWARVMTSGECYEAFGKAGLEYGEGHRCIETLYGGEREALARLVMPAAAGGRGGEYVLHPSMLDGALQAAIGLEEWKGGLKAMVPFAADEVEVFGRSDVEMWAAVRAGEEEKSGKIDIELCDGQGKVSVKIKGLTLIGIGGEASQGMLMAEAKWKEEKAGEGAGGPEGVKRVIILCEPSGIKGEEIEERIKGSRCITLMPEKKGEGIGERYVEYAKRTIEEIRGIMQGKAEGEVLVQAVFGGSEKGLFAGLMGIMKSAKQERPWISAQAIEVGEWEDTGGIADKIEENARNREEGRIRYGEGKRWVEEYKEIEAAGVGAEEIPWKEGGVYLITGGAGGLGRIISEDIAEKAKGCVIVMTGRSALSKEKDAWIGELEKKGAKAEYRQADVSRIEEVKGVMSGIKKKHGKLDGIIHIAGVIRDSFIINKSAEEIEEVMSPKVKGVVNLDEASRGMEPELFIMFSSIAGVTGNVGQADYAAANAFMDGYAKRRQGKGKTISIDWGLWKEGGMKVDGEIERMMKMRTGMTALGTVNGIKALYRIIGMDMRQAAVMEGDTGRMKGKLFTQNKTEKVKSRTNSKSDDNGENILEKIRKVLIITVSRLLKVKIEYIDIDNELSEYGFDSITLTGFANILNQEHGLELSPALFFEFKTLRSFAEYLAKEHGEVFEAKNPEEKKEQTIIAGRITRRRLTGAGALSMGRRDEPVAIVGMSGIFPGARDVEEFWNNLVQGKEHITEIPEDRWDWRKYYGDPQKEANKTNIKWGGFIEGVYEFDPLFFGISPREAELMDPQQRLLMTYVWKVIEDAGYSPKSLSGSMTGIFVGTGSTGYEGMLQRAGKEIEGQSPTGVVPSVGPNRMSYFLDIHGPSEPIETACSSSLVAIHRAVSAIGDGSCEMAIAGGVNTIITPEGHISFNKAGMLCEDGRCKTFSDKANGYVRGEGAGMLFLKKLGPAREDGDHIYGVIRSTAENHGGRSNSLTAPNPKAQADLIAGAYKKAGIDPGTVTYIEAHGTGTPLGDPIEIKGLEMAFRELYKSSGKTHAAKAYCGIGTVKSNIGHLELAAGVAGVIKVLLQLKHKTLIKSLNCENVNPYIDLKDSPFYIVQENKEWKALQEDGKELPRLAGVSSFGFGGANAHVVIEEYIESGRETGTGGFKTGRPAIIVLSAKNEERLREKAKDLLAALEREGYGDERLAGIEYTLQAGRESMEERLGFTAITIKELKEKLEVYMRGGGESAEIYLGQTKRNKEALAIFSSDEDLQKAVEVWVSKGKYEKLIDLWVKGMNFDWNKLYDGRRPGRISLPAYPFARERYLIGPSGEKNKDKRTFIHPLVQENVSNFTEQRFSTVFSGREFFFEDHRVKGRKIMPGVVYLEMARAAIEKAAEVRNEEGIEIRLSEIIWVTPFEAEGNNVKINIGLDPEEDGSIDYEVYSEAENGEIIVHSQGRGEITEAKAEEKIDIDKLLGKKWVREMTAEECYGIFSKMGIEYGQGHRGIEKVYAGESEALARLRMPEGIIRDSGEYVLHPSVMDSAFQASIGLKEWRKSGIAVPYSIDKVEARGKCGETMWAVLRRDGEKVDIDLCDDEGKICVLMKGLAERELEGDYGRQGRDLILTPLWEEERPGNLEMNPSREEKVVIIGGSEDKRKEIKRYYPGAGIIDIQKGQGKDEIAEKLKKAGEIDHLIWIGRQHRLDSIEEEGMIEGQEEGVIQIYRIIKAMIDLGYDAKGIGMSIITVGASGVIKGEGNSAVDSGIKGLIGSIGKEYLNWKIRLADMEDEQDWPIEEIFRLPVEENGEEIAYRGGKRYKLRLMPVGYKGIQGTAYKERGVYVVIGGAGGIGEVWSEYVIRKYSAKVIWIGRREKDEAIQEKIERLGRTGEAPWYIKADAGKKEELERAFREIKGKYENINGVIHSAIVLKDGSLAKMGEDQFREVLSAKVDVSVRIAQVFKEEALDFVMFFSSMQSFRKSAGQSNYAAGCTFKDEFAKRMAREWKSLVKVINWGYWGEIGAVASKEYRERMEKIGLGSIEPEEAMKALEELLKGGLDEIGLIKTIKGIRMEEEAEDEYIEVETEGKHIDMEGTGVLKKPEEERIKKGKRIKKEIIPSFIRMEELISRIIWCELGSMGWFKEKAVALEKLKEETGVIGKYGRWIEEALNQLEKRDYLIKKGDTYEVSGAGLSAAGISEVWEEWEREKEKWKENGVLNGQAELSEATLRSLKKILKGEALATDIIFPESSMKLVEAVYKNNEMADYYNEEIAELVGVYMEGREEGGVRIFEIGAGTGGTSVKVFEKLKGYKKEIKEYCYTDKSRAFLMHGEKEYGGENAYLTYRIFDVENPLEEQGIKSGSFDIVIAANVLHATRNIKETLRNAKALLKKGGIIMLNEILDKSLFMLTTFGLLEGWWLYEDGEARIPGSPGLSPEMWNKILSGEGFGPVLFPFKRINEFGQQIIVGESDGIVRQKRRPLMIDGDSKVKPEKTERGSRHTKQRPFVKEMPGEPAAEKLREKSREFIKKLVAETIKIHPNKIDPSEPLEKYGIDSILVVKLTNSLRKVFDNVNSTMFFEYKSIDALVEHFLETRKEEMVRLSGMTEKYGIEEKYDGGKAGRRGIASGKNRLFLKRSNAGERSKIRPAGNHEIAVIGLSGRYPGSNNIREFWNNLKAGKNCITEIPRERWDWKEYYDPDKNKTGKIYSKWGGFIEGVDEFDPLFFNISPREAELMDPQERLFLEEAYRGIEDSGYTPERLSASRKVGVFVGVMNGNYPTGSFYSSIANRVSFVLNLQGPSMAVDTACSSSLTAIHLACQSIESGECDAAIAGGVNLIVSPVHYMKLTSMTMLSSGDRCKSFGDNADGFVDGEGVGAVLLKPLSKAEEDGDHIYGIIKGSMLNAGGKTNGYTVPNPAAQGEVIREAIERAGVDARSISYIEAHGTGTLLGDPIEIAGLTRAFGGFTKDRQFCAIGSVKSNIGHCESAAGIAALTKVLLQMKHRQLVPSLHSEVLNPNINFSETPFRVQRELAEWDSEYPRIAGISSFGAGGANAHIVIEEYEQKAGEAIEVSRENPAVIILSAMDEERLKERARDLLAAVEREGYGDDRLGNIAYTLQAGREGMEERLGFTAETVKEFLEKLESYIKGEEGNTEIYRGQVKRNKDTISSFNTDEEMQKLTDEWINKRKYGKLIDLWVKGLVIDWEKMHSGKTNKISLPTYPFAKEKYWLSIKKSGPDGKRIDKEKRQNREKAVLVKEWQKKEIKIKINENENSGIIVVLGTTATIEIGMKLFKKNGRIKVINAIHGKESRSEMINTDFYSEPEGENLYKKVKENREGKRLLGVIDITAVDAGYEGSLDVEKGKIKFLQMLIDNDRDEEYKLLQVTYRLNNFRIEKSTMQGARLAGLYRMLGSEYKGIESGTMDSDLGMKEHGELEGRIEKEFFNRGENLTESCYRNEERYEPLMIIWKAEREIIELQKPEKYDKDEVALITGGTRGIGAEIAESIVKRGIRNLVIMGREELPRSEDWGRYLEENKRPEIREKIEKMQGYINDGVKVQYYNTPLTDEEGIRRMLKKVVRDIGEITGVYHCAGITSGDPAFIRKSRMEMESVCDPKIKGMVTLHKALSKGKLKSFILFSSISSIVPALSVGQSDYAMANSYMDYYAMSLAGERNIKSVQWPAWGETGMAAGTKGMHTEAYMNSGLESMTTEEGLEFLEAIKKIEVPVAAPCIINPELFSTEDMLKREIKSKNVKRSLALINRRDNAANESVNAGIKNWLKEVIKLEFKLSEAQIDEGKPFGEYGIDSIIMAQIVQTLQKRINKPVSPSLLLENKTINELTKYFSKNHEKELKEVLGLEPETSEEVEIKQEIIEEREEYIYRDKEEEIAIVGISCRLPGAPSKKSYWELLTLGKKAIREVPEDRWRRNGGVKDYGGWLDDIDMFDPEYFKLKENDAMIMDPQARLILEESLKAVYDAGYENNELSGQKVGVYVGGRAQTNADLGMILRANNPILGVGQNYLATNISRYFNLTGPSLIVDTACSSGLTAISMASDSLKNGRIDMAMIGTVNIISNPFVHEMFEARNILNKSGEFHIFDKRSGGEVLGEGAGVVMLKRLSDSIRDGNKIYGVIKAIAINNDGRTLGPGSPNIEAQKQVIKESLKLSGKRLEDVGYIEISGGGSPVVDSIEIKALSNVYRLDNQGLGPCAIGSVKPNIGHLLLTSGLAGFIRCALSLDHKQIPPFLSALDPADYYDFKASRILFNRETVEWKTENGKKRTAAQNSFPDGGTNCHIIMEEFVPEGDYMQKLFSKPVPEMNRRSFAAVPGLSAEGNMLPGSEEEIGFDEFIDKYKERNDLVIDEKPELPIRNVWGKFNEKNI